MNKNITQLKWYILVFASLLVIVHSTDSVWAQDQSLSIEVFSPPEGATFYAGPTSLAYNIPISGRVDSQGLNPDQIEIKLDIIQNNHIYASQLTQLRPDRTFEFYVMVNPEGSSEVFGPDILACGDECHFKTEMSFPNGSVQVKLTATGPHEEYASVIRQITIDRSDYADIPIQVINIDDPSTPIAGLQVRGSTWIYLWRTRHATQATNDQGIAFISAEALSQAHTRYIFQVEPIILDGVLYEGIESIEVVFPPGAKSSDPITLMVRSRMGAINGKLITKDALPVSPISLWAIHLPEGLNYQTNLSQDNTFSFNDLPIGEYLLAADKNEIASYGYTIEKQEVTLVGSRSEDVVLNLAPIAGYSLHGSVLDTTGQPIPFAWISVEELQINQSVETDSGTYHLHGLPSLKETVIVRAPGYFSQAHVIDFSASSTLDFTLKSRLETKNVAWGNGSVTIPPESYFYQDDQIIALENGWLWGKNDEPQLLVLQTRNHVISLERGSFAIEYLPGNRAWLFIFEGSAEIQTDGISGSVYIQSGEMVNLQDKVDLVPVDLNPILIDIMQSSTVPVDVIWEPTLVDKFRDQMASLGVNLVQAITFVVYLIAIIIILALPVVGVYWWRKNKT